MVSNYFKRAWSVACICALVIAGCEKPKPMHVYDVQLSTNSVAIGACGGDCRVEVIPYLPSNDSWSVERDGAEEWFSCSVDGNYIVVSIEANELSAVREGSFNVVSAKDSFEPRRILVLQEAADIVDLVVDAPDKHIFDSAASSYIFGVRSNAEWTIETDVEWMTVAAEPKSQRATIAVEANNNDSDRQAEVRIAAGDKACTIAVTQTTHANNPYYRLIGQWEITASKWFYSPNGSLNSLDYTPNPSDYYLIFDLEETEYAKTLKMRDFLYPGTELEVRYDATTGGIVIPFGWTVLSYDVFFYVTMLNSSQFSYASLEVEAVPNDESTVLTLDMPTVDGFNYVGFGLWTYDENGNKVAVGSNYRPTMFPMGDIQFIKKSE